MTKKEIRIIGMLSAFIYIGIAINFLLNGHIFMPSILILYSVIIFIITYITRGNK